MIEFIASVLFTIADNELYVMFICIGLVVIVFLFSLKIRWAPLKSVMLTLSVFIFIYSIFNIFFGHKISGFLINKYGLKGSAIVADIRQTNDQYNDYWVYEYTILIETKDNMKIETTFRSSDFNVHPAPDDGYIYPNVGEKFSVKYLKRNPKAFVILSNDNSQYAKRLRCGELSNTMNILKRKYDFDPANKNYRIEYLESIEKYLDNDCADSNIISFYKKEIEKLEE